jgi:hypothetical protein
MRRSVSPLNPCSKQNITFALTKRVQTAMLTTTHCTYSYIILLHKKQLFYTISLSAHLISTPSHTMYISCNSEVHCVTNVMYKSSKYYIFWVFVALCIHHAMYMHRTVSCDLSSCTVFCHITSSMAGFFLKVTEYKIYVLIFLQLLSESLLRTQWDVINDVHRSSWTVQLLLSDWNKLEFSQQT